MNLGKHIRSNRLRLNLTQEKLAEKLNVTAQAVSKWESGATLPDITLLPELSAILGITIDELFETSEEMQLNRIEAMVEKETLLSRSDFDYAVSILENLQHKADHKGRCLTLLADLYLRRSNGYAEKAAEYAKRALETTPESHENHGILFHAMHGALGDWCCTNHTQLIDYYMDFIKKNPYYLPGYMWLTDNLIADGRLEEALEIAEKMKGIENTYHYFVYRALIARAQGDMHSSKMFWQEMLQTYPDSAKAWFVYGDDLAKQARYREAIAAFEKSALLEKVPRYTDSFDSIAQLCLLLEDKPGAIQAYENVIKIMQEDWKITEGATVDGYRQRITQLKA